MIYTCAGSHVEVKVTLGLVLFFHIYVGSRDLTHILRLDSSTFSHFASQVFGWLVSLGFVCFEMMFDNVAQADLKLPIILLPGCCNYNYSPQSLRDYLKY